MSALALWSASDATAAVEPNAKPGLFQRLIKAQEKKALRHIQMFLAAQSDERLQDLGTTAGDIEAIRQGRPTFPRR